MATRTSVTEKIRKIQALADNSAATPGEREAALRMIANLRASNSIPNPSQSKSHLRDVFEGYKARPSTSEEPRYSKPKENYSFNWVYTKEKVNMSMGSNGKIRLDFSDTPCTEKQFKFIILICDHFTAINRPIKSNVTYDSAISFLAIWAPKYQRRFDNRQQERSDWQEYTAQQRSKFSKGQSIFDDVFRSGGFGFGWRPDWGTDFDDD